MTTCITNPARRGSFDGPVYRRPFGLLQNRALRREIESLDARRDCQRIVHLLYAYEFPLDILRSSEMALFYSYGSRSISRLLYRTGEFTRAGQKRYDDTRLLIASFVESGWDGDAGARALARMNSIHSRFRIPNDDFLFVLWTFIDFPPAWIEAYGWRAMTAHERDAWFQYWCEIGRRMGLHDIPATPQAYDEFVRSYESRELVYDPANQHVAEATVAVMQAWLPKPLRFVVRPAISCLVPPRLLRAIGFAPPPPVLRAVLRVALKLRAFIKRWVSLERYPTLLATARNRSYPGNVYRIEDLGRDR